MAIYVINPLSDRRWDELVERHPHASIFHLRGWLEALHRTYGYKPFVLTSAPPEEPLKDGIVLCRVSSWLTGTRLVSLPFADHCEALLNGHGNWTAYIEWLRSECHRQRCKYVEIRPLLMLRPAGQEMHPSGSYCLHTLDIRSPERQLFERLHKSFIQRKIRRAEREQLSYEAGRSERLQVEFYRLLLITRRRHLLPPQPKTWFKNLAECMGERLLIRVVRKNGVAIAAMLSLRHRSSVVYKYGCSDGRFHNLGGMPFLFWRLIQEAKASGAQTVDFGRSDLHNQGLIAFKDNLGTTKTTLTYYRYPAPTQNPIVSVRISRAARHCFAFLPDAFLSTAGRLLYRHIG